LSNLNTRPFLISRIVGEVSWSLIGEYNAYNALAAIIAANNIGISTEISCNALSEFKSVKRRLECIFDANDIRIYDDFAHHPTAIAKTLQALRLHAEDARIIAVMEPRSNTMRMGIHADILVGSFVNADQVLLYQADNLDWDIAGQMTELGDRCRVFTDIDAIIESVTEQSQPGDLIVIMSNGGFGGIHKKLIKAIS